jgi:hypothetical protein
MFLSGMRASQAPDQAGDLPIRGESMPAILPARFAAATILVELLLLTFPIHTTANPGDIYLYLYSSSRSWENRSVFGHAFACMAYHLSSGIKEECYGFYPKTTGALLVGGPGVADNEGLAKRPNRFNPGELTGEIGLKITSDQRHDFFVLLDTWNSRNYNLTNSNCIDFIDAVAASLHLNRPPRSPGQTPTAYLTELKRLNPR